MTTEERLAKVERELERAKRRSRWLLAALGLGLGALALVWASAASVPKAEAQDAAGGRTVRANEFILEDERGQAIHENATDALALIRGETVLLIVILVLVVNVIALIYNFLKGKKERNLK